MAKKNNSKPAVDVIRSLGRIVSVFFFGLVVVSVLRFVDDHYRVAAELAVQEGLVGANSEKQQELANYRENAKAIESSLAQWDARAIDESELNQVQDQLVALAKSFKCTLKKASPRGNLIRDFESEGTDKKVPQANGMQSGMQQTEFEILEVGLAVSVEGELKSTMQFLEAIKQQKWICTTNQLVLRRDPSKSGHVALELELGFQSLRRKPQQNQNANFGSPRA